MKVYEFFYELRLLAHDMIHYHAYSSEPVEREINLDKEKDEKIEGQIKAYIEEILDELETEVMQAYSFEQHDEFLVSLPNILEVVMVVRGKFDSVLNLAEEKSEDSYERNAIHKVRMIHEDLFNKIPQLAGQVYFGE